MRLVYSWTARARGTPRVEATSNHRRPLEVAALHAELWADTNRRLTTVDAGLCEGKTACANRKDCAGFIYRVRDGAAVLYAGSGGDLKIARPDAGQETGDSTSLQRGFSRSDSRKKRIHALGSPREMIARPNMSQIESKTIEM